MLALSLVTVGIYAAIGTFWSLPTSILTGTGAAGGLAVIGVTSLWLALRASKGKRASEEQECGRTLRQLHN